MKTNRRRFLKTAALTVPLIVASRHVRGSEANEKIRLGVVGLGGRGGWITDLFNKDGNYEIAAVADYHPAVAEAAGERFGVPAEKRFIGLSGYKRMLETDIDAIALEAVPYFYPEHVRASVDAGKHVYMAKPVAVDIWGTRSVRDDAARSQKNGKVFLVDFQVPTNENNRKALECVRNDEIGRVVSLQTCYFAGWFGDPAFTSYEQRLQHLNWVNDDILGGSYHVNACIHGVEAGLELVGGELPVSAQGLSINTRPNAHGDSHSMYSLTFNFEDGRLWAHHGIHHERPFHVRAVAHGTHGVAEIGYTGRACVRGSQGDKDFGEITDLYPSGASANIAKFARAVRAGDTTNDTVDISINANYVTILGREAGKRRSQILLADLIAENHRYELDTTGWERQ